MVQDLFCKDLFHDSRDAASNWNGSVIRTSLSIVGIMNRSEANSFPRTEVRNSPYGEVEKIS